MPLSPNKTAVFNASSLDDANNEGSTSPPEASFLAPENDAETPLRIVQQKKQSNQNGKIEDGDEEPAVVKSNSSRLIDHSGPSYKDQVQDRPLDVTPLVGSGKNRNVRSQGPGYKDQMREACHTSSDRRPSAAATTNPPPQGGEVQLVDAALVPQEDVWLAEKAMAHNERRGKRIMLGFYTTIGLNVLLVGGVLFGVLCRGSCRRTHTVDDEMNPLSVMSCERAIEIDLVSSKRRISGTLMTDSLSTHPLSCDPDPNIPGNWYRVKGTGVPLVADTCSALTNADTTISVYTVANTDNDDLSSSCDSLNCIETNDDFRGCTHGEEFSQVGWFGKVNETYFIRVSGYDQQSLGSYSLAIDEFFDQPQEPCELSSNIECQSNGTDCNKLEPPLFMSCAATGIKMLQFQYQYATCTQPTGVDCEDYALNYTADPASENMTLGCFSSTNVSERLVLNTAPRFVSPGELVTLHTLLNDQLRGILECDINNADTGDRLQHLRFDLNQTTLGDTHGSLRLVGCDHATCFPELSFETYVANDGTEPLRIVLSLFEIRSNNTLVTNRVDLDGSIVLNPGDE
jgi:hypothetical protein